MIPFLIVFIYIDRMLITYVFVRFFTLLGHLRKYPEWLKDLIDLHVVIFTITDFISSCIQLYLTYQFTPKDQDTVHLDGSSNNEEKFIE